MCRWSAFAPIPAFAVSVSAERRRAGSDVRVSEEARYIESFTAPSLSAASAEVVNERSRFGLNVATGTHAVAVANVVEAAGIEPASVNPRQSGLHA